MLLQVWSTLLKIVKLPPTNSSTQWELRCTIFTSVSAAQKLLNFGGQCRKHGGSEMVTMSTGTFTSIDTKEVIDSKSMTAAMNC